VIIIDYKTGEVSSTSWSVPRPDQPQLPLYAVSVGGEGVAFSRVKKGDCRIVDQPRGVAGPAQSKPEETPDWSNCLNQWDVALSALAKEITSGFGLVDPKRGSTTCRNCELPCFCRIHDSQPEIVTAAEDES
jgi:hypothetical protein